MGIPPLPAVPCCDGCPLSIAKNSVTSWGRALLVTAGQYMLPGLARSTYHGHLSYVFNWKPKRSGALNSESRRLPLLLVHTTVAVQWFALSLNANDVEGWSVHAAGEHQVSSSSVSIPLSLCFPLGTRSARLPCCGALGFNPHMGFRWEEKDSEFVDGCQVLFLADRRKENQAY